MGRLRGQGIEPQGPVLDGEAQTGGMMTRAAFSHDRRRDVCVCPGGHATGPRAATSSQAGSGSPGPSPRVMRPMCSEAAARTGGLARMVTRQSSTRTSANTHHQLAGTAEFKRSARERRRVEMLLAHLKRELELRRLRRRGPTGAGDDLPRSPPPPRPSKGSPEAWPFHPR